MEGGKVATAQPGMESSTGNKKFAESILVMRTWPTGTVEIPLCPCRTHAATSVAIFAASTLRGPIDRDLTG